MAYNSRRSGQAMAEFVVALLAMVLIVFALVEFVPVFLHDMGLLKGVREEAGTASISSDSGVPNAGRSDEFTMDFPDFLMPSDATSGHLVEKLHMPAANLTQSELVMIPAISGTTETLRYSNRDGTSEFLSALSSLPEDQALTQAAGVLSGAGWTILEVRATDACILAKGDVSAPSAVMAVHAQSTLEGDGQTVLTIIARSAGSSL